MNEKRILLISSRQLREIPDRELGIKNMLEDKGFKVTFVLPGRSINNNGYTDEIANHEIVNKKEGVYVPNQRKLNRLIRKNDAIFFGSWKQYDSIVARAQSQGKPTLSFNSTGGMDHWAIGEHICCVKSPITKRYLMFVNDLFDRGFDSSRIHVTGSVIYDNVNNNINLESIKSDLFDKYDLDKKKPLAVLFPKAILGMRKKVRIWFKTWSNTQCDLYCNKLEELYQGICSTIYNSGYNIAVKMHPTAYTSYMTDYDFENFFWSKFKSIRLLDVVDSVSLFKILDVGIGVNSHAALDTGYFGKPFIYVDSEKFQIPKRERHEFDLRPFCDIPKGPSSHWENNPLENVNPWFPSWLGYYSKLPGLKDLLIELKNDQCQINEDHKNLFIKEFWHNSDGESGKRIVDKALELIEDYDFKRRKIFSPFRHFISK